MKELNELNEQVLIINVHAWLNIPKYRYWKLGQCIKSPTVGDTINQYKPHEINVESYV